MHFQLMKSTYKNNRYSIKIIYFRQLILKFLLITAAWVHRGFSDDVTDVQTIQPGGDLLTDFQKDKFRYFFLHVLDLNSDYVISKEDFDKLNEVRSLIVRAPLRGQFQKVDENLQ